MKKRTASVFIVVFLCTILVAPFFATTKIVAHGYGYSGELLSTFTTDFSSSSEGRKTNVRLAAKRIDGIVIGAGEVFSFNDVTGERTVENGYATSPIIEYGQYTLGVGGGVCQVSTTLYNAVIRAGLKILSVAPHSLPVGYVSPSMDAMVSQATDFRFFNNTPYNITIRSETKSDKLTFKIYGYKMITDGEEIRFVSKVVDRLPAVYQEVVDSENLIDDDKDTKIIKQAKDGLVSECYKETYYRGKLLKSVRIRRDSYAPQDGVVLVRAKEQKEEINSIA
ncbi:MAG: VanW family protein [Clostridia bacterium]|nr:VanW family protein [Clostridia bacterium]